MTILKSLVRSADTDRNGDLIFTTYENKNYRLSRNGDCIEIIAPKDPGFCYTYQSILNQTIERELKTREYVKTETMMRDSYKPIKVNMNRLFVIFIIFCMLLTILSAFKLLSFVLGITIIIASWTIFSPDKHYKTGEEEGVAMFCCSVGSVVGVFLLAFGILG